MTGVNYILAREIEEAIDDGVISGIYSNFNVPSISELEHRISVMDEIDIYVVIKSLVLHRRDLFVKILEYMNKEAETETEGEKDNEND